MRQGEACVHISYSHRPCSPCAVSSSDHPVISTGNSSIPSSQFNRGGFPKMSRSSQWLSLRPCRVTVYGCGEDSNLLILMPPGKRALFLPISFVTIIIAHLHSPNTVHPMPGLSDRQPPGYQENYIIGKWNHPSSFPHTTCFSALGGASLPGQASCECSQQCHLHVQVQSSRTLATFLADPGACRVSNCTFTFLDLLSVFLNL